MRLRAAQFQFKSGTAIFKIGHCARKQASTLRGKKNILRTWNKGGTKLPETETSLDPHRRLSCSRIPAIRSATYVCYCPAYRRRILHGQIEGSVRRAFPDRAPVRQGLGDEAGQERPLDGCRDGLLGFARARHRAWRRGPAERAGGRDLRA